MGKNASALRPRERGGKSCHHAARSQRGHSAAEISLLDRSAVKKNHFSLSAGFISQRGAEIQLLLDSSIVVLPTTFRE